MLYDFVIKSELVSSTSGFNRFSRTYNVGLKIDLPSLCSRNRLISVTFRNLDIGFWFSINFSLSWNAFFFKIFHTLKCFWWYLFTCINEMLIFSFPASGMPPVLGPDDDVAPGIVAGPSCTDELNEALSNCLPGMTGCMLPSCNSEGNYNARQCRGTPV